MNENAKKWIAALRSGEFKQGKGSLCKIADYAGPKERPEFCCLGVACELALKDGVIEKFKDNFTISYGKHRDASSSGSLTPPVMEWLGINRAYGAGTCKLAAMNDSNASFATIADYIEKNAQEIFK